MKKLLATAALPLFTALAALGPTAAWAGPAYAPTGPQIDVARSTVTDGGWSLCFASPYGAVGPTVAQAVSDCGGDLMMLAAVRVDDAGSPLANLSLLAWATKADVMFNTGASDVTHLANGAEWYFSANWSWGFAPGGATVERDSCDLAADGDVHAVDASTPYRLCWHTGGGNMNGGWRVGGDIFQNLEPTGYLKYIYTAQSSPSVPEPSGIALAAIALAGVAGLRRRRAVR